MRSTDAAVNKLSRWETGPPAETSQDVGAWPSCSIPASPAGSPHHIRHFSLSGSRLKCHLTIFPERPVHNSTSYPASFLFTPFIISWHYSHISSFHYWLSSFLNRSIKWAETVLCAAVPPGLTTSVGNVLDAQWILPHSRQGAFSFGIVFQAAHEAVQQLNPNSACLQLPENGLI